MTPTLGALQVTLQSWAQQGGFATCAGRGSFCKWGSGHIDPGASQQDGGWTPRYEWALWAVLLL